MRHRPLLVIALVALTTVGCANDSASQVGTELAHHYLDPLADADVAFTVEHTCHLPRRVAGEAWHLEIHGRVDAERDRVADLFEGQGVVVVRDREAFVLQQEPGVPTRGWTGSLEPVDEQTSELRLTYNNVTPGNLGDAGGWLDACRSDAPIPPVNAVATASS